MSDKVVYGKFPAEGDVILQLDAPATFTSGDAKGTRFRFTRKPVEPPPEPEPEPPAGKLPLITPGYLASLPRSGKAYEGVKKAADATVRPDLDDQDGKGNTNALARALLGRDTTADLAAMRATFPDVSSTLHINRELQPMALVSYLGGTVDPVWFLNAVTTGYGGARGIKGPPGSENSVRASAHGDPTNWGSHGRATLMCIATYQAPALLPEALDNVRRYLENGSGWQYKQLAPELSWGLFTIAPKGHTKTGMDLDGAIHDIYRSGVFPKTAGDGMSYVWEAFQGTVASAVFADQAGHPEVWEWGDRAILRAAEWMYRVLSNPATGDDTWIPWVLKRAYGSAFTRPLPPSPTSPGKGFGWADWLWP